MSTVTRDYWRDVELKYFSPIMEMWTQLTNVLFNGRWQGGWCAYCVPYSVQHHCTLVLCVIPDTDCDASL